MKSKREITFVLTDAEIRLLMQADKHFAKEFGGRTLAKRYEFTWSREALESLGFWVTGYAWFITPKHKRHRFDRIIERLNGLRRVSDAFSVQLQSLRRERKGKFR